MMPRPATAASTARSVAAAGADEQRPGGIDLHDLAVALELPGRHRAAGELAAQAGEVEQVARMLGPAVRVEIGGRRPRWRSAARAGRSARRSCPARAARHSGCRRRSRRPARRRSCPRRSPRAGCRDRLQGRAARCGGRTSRAALTGTLSRSVPAGRSRKALTTSSAASISPQRRRQPLEQARAGLGRGDAARGAVEQPHAQPGLQPAHRLAEAGGADAARPRRLAKAARARHRDEGREVAEVRRHCSLFRTACADYTPIIAQRRRCLYARLFQQGDMP